MILLSAVMIYVGPLAPFALAQFQWSQRIASIANLPSGILDIGLALDTNANCYVTGWFDGTNNFGGITLTNHSTGGGSDIFVAKYNSSGTLQWVQPAGQSAGNVNYGRAVGADTNGNIYVTGGYQGPATFGNTNLSATSGEQFFLAKYNAISGTNQWVKPSTGGNGNNSGIGLTVDGAGNCYALAVMDYVRAVGTSISFGSSSGSITVTNAKNGTTFLVLVKYDSTGTAQWAQLFDSSVETYGSKVAVDAAGNVYVRGTFTSDMTIGSSNLTVSAGSTKNMFIAKFNNSGLLVWVQQPMGGNVDEGGVAVDPVGNVFVSGAFNTNLNFGTNLSGTLIILTNMANGSASSGDAFLAKYNSAGVIQWAQAAGGANGGYYMDIALDTQTNIYAAGGLVSGAAVSKYSPAGTLQWTYAANGPVGSTVSKCAVDAVGHCYVNGIYQGTTAFGTNALQPQEAWNFFLAETVTNPTVQFTANPTSGLPPLTVQFNSANVDSQGNTITSWNWNFGDGTTTNAQNPSHTYTNTGTFNPGFVATNNHNVAVIGYGSQIAVTNLIISPFTVTTNNGSITITSYIGPSGAVVIPPAIYGYPVTGIGANAFWYRNGQYGTPDVTSVTIPNSVTSIGDYAFSDCTSLTNVTLGTNVTSIGANAFSGNKHNLGDPLPSITIPNSVTNIGDYAFSGCGSLTNVTIPNSVTSIGDYAFSDCTNLTNITLGTNVTSIGAYAFSDNYEYEGDPLSSITIPNSVTNIGAYAFWECTSLTNVTLGTNITSIGAYAFSGQIYAEGGDPFSSITIPNSVTSIGDGAFNDCYSLTSVTIPNRVTSIGDNVFSDCSSLTSITLGTNVTSIGDGAFSGTRLTSITIPNSVTSIGDYAFSSCSSLTSITFPNSVTNIGAYAFSVGYEGDPLSSITIPNSIINIGEGAFIHCASLTSAAIQGGAIGDYAFCDCFSLTSVTLGTNVTSIGAYAFSSEEYEGDPLSSITIPNSVTSIGANAFSYCYELKYVTLGTKVTSIGDNAFSGIYGGDPLSSITIPNSVTNIGTNAFLDCASLHQAYFQGNAPIVDGQPGSADSTVFESEWGTAYYLPGTTGWGATFGGWPTALWYQPTPTILGSGYGLGVRSNSFGFTISWATNISVVVQATTNLANPVWTSLATNPLVGGTNYFSDPKWTNYPRRFYRITTP